MKFNVSRTSSWENDQPPCDGAQKFYGTRVDRRTVDDPKKIAFYGGNDEWWFGEGTRHRVEGGNICRNFPAEYWQIEISSLDELIKFVLEHGDIVVGFNVDHMGNIPEIEIYDGYRE